MKIDAKYFSFCKTVGVMTENFGREAALQQLTKVLKETAAADPEFVNVVSKLTLQSPEVSIRACVLYHYSVDVDYVIGGHIKSTTIEDFGYSGAPDSMHITQYHGKGEYQTLKDPTDIPLPIFNSDNLFTLEGMKHALADAVDNALKGNTDFHSKSWDVCAYLVPILVLIVPFKGKEYHLYYNLQNGYYSWAYPNNPALLKKGDTVKTINVFGKIACILLSALTLLLSFVNGGVFGKIMALAILIAQFVIAFKTKKEKQFYRSGFLKDPKKGIVSYLIPVIVMGILVIVSFAVAFM